MADVASDLKSWSATASSNAPAGTTNIGTQLDDNLREIQKVVRQDLATKGADIASATTTDLGAVAGLMHDITGTTTITSFGTVAAGIWKIIKFEGALTLTHNATSLILPGGANITTANGDTAIVMSEGSGNWRCLNYQKASGAPVAIADDSVTQDKLAVGATLELATMQASTSGTAIDFTSIPSGVKEIEVMLAGVGTSGTSSLLLQIGDSGGIENSSYAGGCTFTQNGSAITAQNWSGAGAEMQVTGGQLAAATVACFARLTLMDASTNKWFIHGTCAFQDTNTAVQFFVGHKALSATLDRVRITTVNGSDTFDAGSINIAYK